VASVVEVTTSRTPLPPYTHPLLRRQVEDWRRRAGVESATPSAPVVDDRSKWARWFTALRAHARARNELNTSIHLSSASRNGPCPESANSSLRTDPPAAA
jgi:hypothetical protein